MIWIAVGKTMEESADIKGVEYNNVRGKPREAMERSTFASSASYRARDQEKDDLDDGQRYA